MRVYNMRGCGTCVYNTQGYGMRMYNMHRYGVLVYNMHEYGMAVLLWSSIYICLLYISVQVWNQHDIKQQNLV